MPLEPEEIRRLIALRWDPRWRRWHRLRRGLRRAGVAASSRALARLEAVVPRRAVECPACSWRGLAFRPEIRGGRITWGARCPRCRCVERHRLTAFALRRLAERGYDVCLHFAPEKGLRGLVAAASRRIITTDLHVPVADVRADIQALPFRDASVSLIMCSDVLTLVEDDAAAMRELRRMMVDGGTALIHVPLIPRSSFEYGFADPMQRHARRAYGPDIADRLRDAGLTVETFLAETFSPRERRRYGIVASDVLFVASPAPGSRDRAEEGVNGRDVESGASLSPSPARQVPTEPARQRGIFLFEE